LAEAFEHYNEWHPHSALGYRSPREYLRQRACNGLSDNDVWKYRGKSTDILGTDVF
ncbi:integrase core domain-containing protein, partial [Escherichia coli]